MPQRSAWGAAEFLSTLAMWTVMMTAMMLPSAAPMILLFSKVQRKRRADQSPHVPTGIFVGGYLAVWALFSGGATLAQGGLHAATLLSDSMALASPMSGGIVLMAAGAFQWTPLKDACMTRCASPLSFIMTQWREGAAGALRMGLSHGLYCLGCCGLLMAILFVTGVMNPAWVAGVASFVLLEKALPGHRWPSRLGGVLLLVWGAWVISLPWR
jgi:predicted metal-binding membrane protein